MGENFDCFSQKKKKTQTDCREIKALEKFVVGKSNGLERPSYWALIWAQVHAFYFGSESFRVNSLNWGKDAGPKVCLHSEPTQDLTSVESALGNDLNDTGPVA